MIDGRCRHYRFLDRQMCPEHRGLGLALHLVPGKVVFPLIFLVGGGALLRIARSIERRVKTRTVRCPKRLFSVSGPFERLWGMESYRSLAVPLK